MAHESTSQATSASSIPENVDKLIDQLLPYFNAHSQRPYQNQKRPFILALTGLQGSGKSTWSTEIVSCLRTKHHKTAITVSLDDFYLTHTDLLALQERHKANKLLARKGQPGMHDVELATRFLWDLRHDDDGISTTSTSEIQK